MTAINSAAAIILSPAKYLVKAILPILLLLLRLLSRFPLPVLHAGGAVLGLLGLLRPQHRQRIRENLRLTRLYSVRCLLNAAMELGKGLAELPRIWLAPLPSVFSLIKEVRGWELVEAARQQGKGMVLLAPHLGCWEICGMYLASRIPCTALYTPPRQAWVHEMMRAGRERSGVKTVPPGNAGVRALLTSLRAGEAVFILPDQTAMKGEGLWLRFLGEPAYMPALPYRLLQRTDATPLAVFAKRLAWGRGFRLEVHAIPQPGEKTVLGFANAVGQVMSSLIRRHPAQYLWSYRLFRRRINMPPLPEDMQ
jgi:KDO2-lipid IV(A) lauroyltransferase